MKAVVTFLLLLLSGVSSARAFPPAPYYTIFGIVRDQVGQKLDADGAEIILLRGVAEIGRAPITRGQFLDQSYELPIRIDLNRPGTVAYSENAITAQGPYSLAVRMNGTLYYPIEVAGSLTAGKGGERVRLDLNLGEDADGDGLPDIWEQWQLYQAGYLPDGNGDWPIGLINRDGDFDEDGQSNWLEYVAGTFAGDATERFALEIKEKLPNSVRLEFYAITGKTYTIERSTDGMVTWTRMLFAPSAGLASESYRAVGAGILPVFGTPTGAAKEFYRLTVR